MTARRDTARGVRRSEERFRALYGAVSDAVFVHRIAPGDKQPGALVDVNDVACRRLGYTREELLALDVPAIDAPESTTDAATVVAELKQHGEARFEQTHVAKDGRRIPVEIRARTFLLDGELAILSVARDVSDRARHERELRAANELLAQTQTLARIGSWEFDVARQQILWSDETYRLYERDPKLGPPTPDEEERYYPPEHARALRNCAAKAIQTGEGSALDVDVLVPSGKRVCLAIIRAVKDEHGRVVKLAGVVQDVTERKRGEEDVRRSHEALRNLATWLQLAREEERTTLSRELHDNLGQLLTALKLDIAWLEKRVFRGDYREMIEKLRDMWGITDEAIRSVRKLAAELRPAILERGEFWTTVEAEAARFTARSGIPCSVGPGECAAWRADDDFPVAASIIRIVQEALTNVVRHAGAKAVTISCRREPTCHLFSIADDGRGMAPETIADPRSIGIVGMRERALSFGGELLVESAPGRGTTVTVRIPLPAPAEGA